MNAEQLDWFIDRVVGPIAIQNEDDSPDRLGLDIARNPYRVMDYLIENYWLDARHRSTRQNETGTPLMNFADERAWGLFLSEARQGTPQERRLRDQKAREAVVATKGGCRREGEGIARQARSHEQGDTKQASRPMLLPIAGRANLVRTISWHTFKAKSTTLRSGDWFIDQTSKPETW